MARSTAPKAHKVWLKRKLSSLRRKISVTIVVLVFFDFMFVGAVAGSIYGSSDNIEQKKMAMIPFLWSVVNVISQLIMFYMFTNWNSAATKASNFFQGLVGIIRILFVITVVVLYLSGKVNLMLLILATVWSTVLIAGLFCSTCKISSSV